MTVVLGIDPGSRWVAMAVRDLDRVRTDPRALLDHRILDRQAIEGAVRLETWANAVALTASGIYARHRLDVVAVERSTAPSPHLGMTNPAGIIDAAFVAGAILGTFPGTVLIDAARHGDPVPKGTDPKLGRAILEQSYPPELIGARETTGRGKSPRQHARAAYDIAGAAARAETIRSRTTRRPAR